MDTAFRLSAMFTDRRTVCDLLFRQRPSARDHTAMWPSAIAMWPSAGQANAIVFVCAYLCAVGVHMGVEWRVEGFTVVIRGYILKLIGASIHGLTNQGGGRRMSQPDANIETEVLTISITHRTYCSPLSGGKACEEG
eukprot:7063756-Pyramimonas_sp.AAC.1